MFQQTTALTKISQLKKRVRVVQGGTSAGKTVAIMLLLTDLAQTQPWADTTISVVTDSVPNLKKGAMRDFLNIMTSHNYFNPTNWNRSDNIYNFGDGSFIEFFAVDDPAKARGARRRVLYLNEANRLPYTTYEQLEIRTSDIVILDYNPVAEFWAHTEIINNPEVDNDFIIVTYKDNEALDPAIVASIESRRKNTNWFRVYGEGLTGYNEGQIFKDWKPIKEVPPEARLVRRGLDFGYTNHPTAISNIYEWNNAIIIDEIAYQTGLKNKAIANLIRQDEGLAPVSELDNSYEGGTKVLTVADSAEPKSIDEIRSYGVEITGAQKGADSVNHGIQVVQDEEVYVTERSENVWHEQRNYLWKIDKRTEKPLNTPEDDFNHHMDGIRYAVTDLRGLTQPSILLHLRQQAAKKANDQGQIQI